MRCEGEGEGSRIMPSFLAVQQEGWWNMPTRDYYGGGATLLHLGHQGLLLSPVLHLQVSIH